MHPHPPRHLVADIEHVFDPKVKGILTRNCKRFGFDQLMEMLATKAVAVQVARCILHDCGTGGCALVRSAIHIAGTPCIDFSVNGRRRHLAGYEA
eukprot:2222817-Pyramimonas_sp.AAC.1